MITGTKTTIIVNDTDAVTNFDELGTFQNQELIHRPKSNSESVVIHTLKTIIVDTLFGDIINAGHAVGDYIYMILKGGGTVAQAFAREIRYTIKDNTTVGSMYGDKHVLETDAEVDGTTTNLILEDLQDYSGSATWFTNLVSQYLDPRHLFITKGGILASQKTVGTSTHTVSAQGSKGVTSVAAGTGCTITIPAGLSDGYSEDFCQADSHQITFTVSSPGALVNVDGHTKSGGLGSIVNIKKISPGVFVLSGRTGP